MTWPLVGPPGETGVLQAFDRFEDDFVSCEFFASSPNMAKM